MKKHVSIALIFISITTHGYYDDKPAMFAVYHGDGARVEYLTAKDLERAAQIFNSDKSNEAKVTDLVDTFSRSPLKWLMILRDGRIQVEDESSFIPTSVKKDRFLSMLKKVPDKNFGGENQKQFCVWFAEVVNAMPNEELRASKNARDAGDSKRALQEDSKLAEKYMGDPDVQKVFGLTTTPPKPKAETLPRRSPGRGGLSYRLH